MNTWAKGVGFGVGIAVLAGYGANAAAEKSPSRNRMLEEVVVTAQKREQDVSDVPIAINAFTEGVLDARGITDPKELAQITPALTVGSQAGFTVTFLRGVGSDAYLLADPSVAMYIDGIYFPFAHGQAQNFGSIERIEVLKGPQGTLFGRNAVGGAISVSTKNPSLDDFYGSIQASYASFDEQQVKGNINIPITETLAVALSGLYSSADNYRTGTAGGEPLPREETDGVRLKAMWLPVDWIEMLAGAFRLNQTGVSTMFATNSDPSDVFGATIEPQEGLGGDNDAPTYFDLTNDVVYGHIKILTDWFDVKLMGSVQKVESHSLYDFDGSPEPLVFFEAAQSADIQTYELQILSNEYSLASDNLDWIIGYYYFEGDQGLDSIKFGVAGSTIDGFNNILSPVLEPLGIPDLVPSNQLVASGVLNTESESIFAQGTYHLNEWLALTLGVRAQEETRTIVESSGAVDTGGSENSYYVNYSGQSDTTKSITPKVSFEFRFWDDGLIYASYQEAIKSSTYNVVNFLNFSEPEPVLKEELTAYEIGIKKELFGGSTKLSAAAFYYDIQNLQVQFISLLAGGAVTFENAPAAEVKGVDFDVTTQIFPSLVDNLVATLGGAYVDAIFTSFQEGQGFDESGVYSANNDYSGNSIPRSPEVTVTAGLLKSFDLPGGPLEFGVDYYYNSGFFYLAQNTEFNEEKAYEIFGARVSYLHEDWGLRATLYGKNIADTRYNYSRFTNDFGGLDAVAPPENYGIRVNWEF